TRSGSTIDPRAQGRYGSGMMSAIARRAQPMSRLRPDLWQPAATLVAVAMLLPLLALCWSALQGSAGLWSHIGVHVLPRSALNTVLLLAGVGALVIAIGAGAAW